MVNGLDVFQKAFAQHQDNYVLIGGTAAFLTMQEVGQDFRATKDLDIVLHVEVLNAEFGQTVWQFIRDAGYELQQASQNDKPKFYRFAKPSNPDYPFMLELFSRAPDALIPHEGSTLTPIPIDEAVSSLSAILLDDDYYNFIMDGRRQQNGLVWVGEDRLIPLKALAWLNLTKRKAEGEQIDSKNISKHCKDVIRLSALLTPDSHVNVSQQIHADLLQFLQAVEKDASVQPAQLGMKNTNLKDVLDRIRAAYNAVPNSEGQWAVPTSQA